MPPVRVLIVDDSGFFRRRLSEIIARDPRLEVVGMAGNGLEAVTQVALIKPDVISMDIEMPVMDGISAVREIMAKHPTPILMLSTWTTEGAKSTLEALDAGAVDYLPKRFQDMSGDTNVAHQLLCQRLHDLASHSHTNILAVAKASSILHTARPSYSPAANRTTNATIRLVAIGTSTGGPVALQQVLSQLPSDFPHPILLIQHMPATFTPSFAQRLDAQCKITVKQAVDGDKLLPATAYLAPGGMQMFIKGTKSRPVIEIQASQSGQTYKPSIDLTLESLIPVCPAETLVIILTGMGADGREACRKLRPLGATIWAQDQQSSTIYGMPMAIAKAGLTDKILSVNDIGHHLAELR
ncbi:MAG: two-component system chemotaxis response regulator CheB [Methylophagaceae bacterium]|jgi:two-component system chemotaxis response regulator CheB